MEIEKNIKKYRNLKGYSQEDLAEKVLVSRQSISNWETGKTYPDIYSLLRLSETFEISLDSLVKGDIEMIGKEIKEDDIRKFSKLAFWYELFLVIAIVSCYPLVKYFRWVGLGLFMILMTIAMVLAIKLDRIKKKQNIQTFREIQMFLEGKRLDEIEAARESGKRNYQTVIVAILVAAISFAIFVLMKQILG